MKYSQIEMKPSNGDGKRFCVVVDVQGGATSSCLQQH
jgi:hypothetical protein